MRVALLEDEYEWAKLIDAAVRAAGWEMTWFRDAASFVAGIGQERFTVAIADIQLGGDTMRGTDAVRMLREGGNPLPVLMLTQFAAAYPAGPILDDVADDYLAKPFDTHELQARLRQLVRHSGPGDPRTTRIGPLSISRYYRTAHWFDRLIPLRTQGFDLLQCLTDQPGEVVSAATLWREVWPRFNNLPPQNEPIQAGIYQLRRTIRSVTVTELVHTVPGRGYRFDIDGGIRV